MENKMRRIGWLSLAVLGLAFWIGLCFLVIRDATPVNNYRITRFQFGPHIYELSEPTIDWTNFKGHFFDIVRTETFSLHVFEGSDAANENWILMTFIVERTGVKGEPIILCISINENISKTPSEMRSTNLYHRGYIETGREDYRLTTMNPPPDLKKYIDARIQEGKKHAI